ncbi:HAT dimerization [Penicillium chrysogenum]|nr:HAT dimerization [Penicillium chrysogenum]
MSSTFQQYRACIDFVEIEGSHSGENLARIVATVLERFHISDKVMTITADNAPNNDTLHRYLYQKLSQRYDEYLAETIIREGTMKFTHIEALRLTPEDWRQPSDIKRILTPFNEYTEYVSRDSPSIHMAAPVPVSDGISLLEKYHDCVKDNDIYYIASVLDPRIKTKWLKTLPDGEKIIDRIRAFLKKAYPTPKQPASIAPNTNYKSFEYRFLEAFQPTQYNVAESDIDQYFDTPTVSTGFEDHLAIPAAEVDVERLFNGGRDVLGIRRFSMKGKTLGTLIRLKDAT